MMLTLVEAIVPALGQPTRFKRFLNEGDADFREWAQGNPASCFRRFQIRDTGDEDMPDVTNTDREAIIMPYHALVSYAQDARGGKTNALGRDDIMSSDRKQLLHAIGLSGYVNFPDATCLFHKATRIEGKGVDFIAIELRYRFYRAFP